MNATHGLGSGATRFSRGMLANCLCSFVRLSSKYVSLSPKKDPKRSVQGLDLQYVECVSSTHVIQSVSCFLLNKECSLLYIYLYYTILYSFSEGYAEPKLLYHASLTGTPQSILTIS